MVAMTPTKLKYSIFFILASSNKAITPKIKNMPVKTLPPTTTTGIRTAKAARALITLTFIQYPTPFQIVVDGWRRPPGPGQNRLHQNQATNVQ